ncbi:hypothetical protein R3W88_001891 [Solanum pinnatisectum]|uniref:Uncharacterized protein n=1 Tax=Solanum pinnatisectum TaxID=50273 RepID=A0AAV9MM96_9SOLN|nr:hypothetical protein R3W88_001891 [Solanum pinnatisectum]
MEPFQSPFELEQYKRRLGFDKAGVNRKGKSWCFQKDDWAGSIILDTMQQLTIQFTKNDKEFMISAVYARCNPLERLELWEELENITENVQCPWIIGGDFSVILSEEEKLGGLDFTLNEAIDFASFISSCALSEVYIIGELILLVIDFLNFMLKWSKEVFGNVFQQIATLEDIIKVREA